MTITNKQLVQSHAALNVLFNTKLPNGAAQFPLIRFARKYNTSFEDYVTAEKAIFGKYVEKNEDGSFKLDENNQPVFATPEDASAHKAEVEQLQAMDADLQFKPIPVSMLEGVSIEPGLLLALDWVFEDSGDE